MVDVRTTRRWSIVPFCALGLAVASMVGGCAGSADSEPLAMYPIDGSIAANPATTISFRALASDDIGGLQALDDLQVTGSRSGPIAGRVVAHADEQGASFHPDTSFSPGEEIVVATSTAVAGEGEQGFRVAVPADPPEELPTRNEQDLPPPTTRDLITLPDVDVPEVRVEGDLGDGLFLSTPVPHGDSDMGLQITDAEGRLVWWRSPPAENVMVGDLALHTLDGEPVLAWFEGTAPFGVGNFQGEWVVVDTNYQDVVRIPGANGIATDIHDLELTSHGTAVVVAYQPIMMDVVSAGGHAPKLVLDSVVQEVDIETGEVHFEWHSVDHVPLDHTRHSDLEADEIIDYAHINSVDRGPDGDVLVSLRHTSQVMEVDRTTGEPTWILGGDQATVEVVDDPGISYPHHARWLPDGTVSIFDNGVERADPTSRGVVYELSEDEESAEVVATYHADPPTYTETQGSIQHLEDGGLAMWSETGTATRFDQAGRPVGSVDLGTGSYRMFEVSEWTATPAEPPATVVDGNDLVVSWNGATEVATWELVHDGGVVAAVEATGFETRLPLPDPVQDEDPIRVRALDADGTVLEGSQVDAP